MRNSLQGSIHISVLASAPGFGDRDLRVGNWVCRAIGTGNDFSFSFLQSGGVGNPFIQFMACDKLLQIIRVMCGDWLRLDHSVR